MVSLTRDPIDTQALRHSLQLLQDGAVVVFEGIVRDRTGERAVRALEYEAYESMALLKIEEIAAAARERFVIRDIGIIHRLGRLEPGECSVAIVVVAAHRAPAFEACRFAIDTLKTTVPIWKKELFVDD